MGSIITKAANLFMALVALIMLAPLIMPAFGIGSETSFITNYSIICGANYTGGFASLISLFLSKMPIIGSFFAAGSIMAAFAASLLILVGRFMFLHYPHKIAAVVIIVLGIIFALPAILPALGHGLAFLALLANYPETAKLAAKIIGYSGNHTASVFVFAGSFIAAHINCIISGVVIILSYLTPNKYIKNSGLA